MATHSLLVDDLPEDTSNTKLSGKDLSHVAWRRASLKKDALQEEGVPKVVVYCVLMFRIWGGGFFQ